MANASASATVISSALVWLGYITPFIPFITLVSMWYFQRRQANAQKEANAIQLMQVQNERIDAEYKRQMEIMRLAQSIGKDPQDLLTELEKRVNVTEKS